MQQITMKLVLASMLAVMFMPRSFAEGTGTSGDHDDCSCSECKTTVSTVHNQRAPNSNLNKMPLDEPHLPPRIAH